ncbi:MAG TPA: hypothetical protein VFD58_32315 [Blastocatellia bacterium]|nr:hypothetical protein [Blastocatellia bacterium]
MISRRDIKRGYENGELFIARKLELRKNVVHIARGYNPEFDLEVFTPHHTRWLAEVKYDERARETGNVAIEHDTLNHTRSIIWFHVLSKSEAYVCELEKLKEFALAFPVQKPIGEHGETGSCIPLPTFQSLPFVKRFI